MIIVSSRLIWQCGGLYGPPVMIRVKIFRNKGKGQHMVDRKAFGI